MAKHFIYADNAATTQLSGRAFDSMIPYYRNYYANASQPYSFSRLTKRALQCSRKMIADCIGATPDEIYFTSGGSESNNWVINGAVELGVGIVASSIEHHSVLRAIEHANRRIIGVKYLPVSSSGLVEIPELIKSINNSGTLVSVMTANNEIGSIQNIRDLAKVTHELNGIFHTDAVQAIGHIPIDVKMLGVDMLSGSAHKFNGPKGVGFMYIRKGLKWPRLIYGGSQEFSYRAGTENVAGIVGMSTALEENVDKMAENSSHLKMIEQTLIDSLIQSGVRFHRNGDSNHIPGSVSISFDNIEGEMLLHRLDLMGIMVSTGSACDSKETQISHVLRAINLSPTLAKGTIRITFGKNNTIEDAKTIALSIQKIIGNSYV